MNSKPSSQTSTKQQIDERRRTEKFVTWFMLGSLGALIGVQFGAIWIYCSFLPSDNWSAFAAATMVAMACLLVGNLTGFLFGIPRALTSDTGGNLRSRQRFLENTNLEQVSDWLTKIIVGVSLVQFDNILNGLRDLSEFVAPIFGSTSVGNQIMAGATIIYSTVFGFLAAYVAARTVVTVVLYTTPSRIPYNEQDE